MMIGLVLLVGFVLVWAAIVKMAYVPVGIAH